MNDELQPMIQKTLLRTIQQYKLLSANQSLILGVSGGVDSLAMMHLFAQIRSIVPINLHVATYNHGIRGKSGEDDVAFVCAMAEKWHIPYTAGQGDVPHLAQVQNLGIEAAARQARYDFFAQVANEIGTDRVAVAHHADDQAETILMHLIRGSGLQGLTGMQMIAPMPYHPLITLIRPLLQLSRSQLENYCRENELQAQEDETNQNTDYLRNHIRHVIVPHLQAINPNVTTALGRLGQSLALDKAYLQSRFQSEVLQYTTINEKRWHIPRTIFVSLPPALQHRFVMNSFYQITAQSVSLQYENVVHAVDLAINGRLGKIAELGGGLQLRVGYEHIYIEHESAPLDEKDFRLIPESSDLKLAIPSITRCGDIEVSISYEKSDLNQDGKIVEVSEKWNLTIRTRRPGDRFYPLGMKGHSRKLKDWMIDKKIPRQLRDKIPLIATEDFIVAVCIGGTWHMADINQHIDKAKKRAYLTLI